MALDETRPFSQRFHEALRRNSIAIAEVPGKGRGLVAGRCFERGSRVLLEEPFVYALSSKCGSHESFCHHSLASQDRVRLRQCTGCKFARSSLCFSRSLYRLMKCRYASAEDQKKAWSKHRLECRRIRECIDHGYMPSSFLLCVARMFDAKKHGFNTSTATWQDILELQTNYDNWTTEHLASFAQVWRCPRFRSLALADHLCGQRLHG
eukprot:746239-Hanusia_phi.AAC.5